MEDLEDADTKLLQVRLVGQVRLEDAWLSEDEDERGHEPLEKDRVCLAGDIMVEAVAQCCGSFDLLLQLCEEVRMSAWAVSWALSTTTENSPVSGVLSFLTTSSIKVVAAIAPAAIPSQRFVKQLRASPGSHGCNFLEAKVWWDGV